MPRLVIAFGVFVAVVGLADLQGWGHGHARTLLAYVWFLVAMRLSPTGWRRLWACALWSSVAVAAMALWQLTFMPRPFGPFRSANFLGSFAVIMLFIGLSITRQFAFLRKLAISCNIISIAVSQSRGAWLALACAIGVAFWKRAPIVVSSVALVAFLTISYWTYQRGLDDPRFGIWRIAAIAGWHRALLGWGEGGLMLGFTGLTSFYNVALEWFVAAGVCGVAAGAWLCREAALAARGHVYAQAALVAFAVQGMFLSGSPATYLPLVTLLAWLASETRNRPVAGAVSAYSSPSREPGIGLAGTSSAVYGSSATPSGGFSSGSATYPARNS